jgi:hypothetical protein
MPSAPDVAVGVVKFETARLGVLHSVNAERPRPLLVMFPADGPTPTATSIKNFLAALRGRKKSERDWRRTANPSVSFPAATSPLADKPVSLT